MLSVQRSAFAALLAACSILLSSCAEILVAPALDNVHDPLSSTFVPGQSGGLSATQVSDRAVKLSWVRGSQFIVSNRVERKPSSGHSRFSGHSPRIQRDSSTRPVSSWGFRTATESALSPRTAILRIPRKLVFPFSFHAPRSLLHQIRRGTSFA